jgi:hypothetical protein
MQHTIIFPNNFGSGMLVVRFILEFDEVGMVPEEAPNPEEAPR